MKRVLFALFAAAVVSTPALADQALATSKNCMACHAVDKKLVGPSFKDIAKKYDKSATDTLAQKVIKGGSGAWRPVPMPANPQVNDADAKKLVGRHTGITLFVPDLLHYCGDLHARGVRFLTEPTQQPWGIMAMIADPEGNILALWEDRTPEGGGEPVSQADGIS